jgi:DNA-binding transcriptional ArsR family regulator
MVVDLLDDEAVDRLFAALADRTRRDIVRRALVGEQNVSQLAARYAMSFAAVQKHVAVLERAHLVTKRSHGRERLVAADVETIHRASELLGELEALWRGRADRIDALLAEQPPTPPLPVPSVPPVPHGPKELS